MKNGKRSLILAGLFMCAAVVPVLAQSNNKDEKKLKTSAEEIDKNASMPEGMQRVTDKIKTEFGVDDARLQGLRDRNMGYGEISIALGLAQGLPGGITDENVQKIVALRQGPPVTGWGKIAKDLGLKLGPVVSKAHRMSAETGNKGKGEKVKKDKKDSSEKMGKSEKHEKGEKYEKPEKMERPEKSQRGGKH